MTVLAAVSEPFHRMTTTQFGTVWVASCSCGYMGLARESPAAATKQASDEHDKQIKAQRMHDEETRSGG